MSYKTVLNIIKNYQWRGIFFQLWKYIIIAVGVPTIICMCIISLLYANKMYEEYESAFAASSYKSAENFKDSVGNFFELSCDVTQSRELVGFLEDGSDGADNGVDGMLSDIEAKNALKQYLNKYDTVENVWLYSVKRDEILSNCKNFNIDEETERKIARACIDDDSKCGIMRNTYEIVRGDGIEEYEAVTVAFPIYIDSFDSADGVFVFSIPCDRMDERILHTDDEDAVILTSDDRKVCLSGDHTDRIHSISYDEILEKSDGNDYITEKNGFDIYCCVPDDDFDFVVLFSSGEEGGRKIAAMVVRIIVTVILVSLLAMIVLSYAISMLVFDFMIAFVYGVGIYNVNDAKEMVDYKYLGKKFLHTMKRDAKLENEFAMKMSRLRDTQVLALQNQINSHFIFNTLNFVNLMIIQITKRDCAPAQVVTLLSDILHYSLSTEEFTATLEDELSYAEKYVEIEKLKHDNSFEMITDAEESVLSGKCVKFSLQPILENCIMHGFNTEMEEKGIIRLSIFREEENVHISIKNNGTRAPERKIDELNRSFKETDVIKRGRHIGLANVNQRLKIIFGDDASMRVYNDREGFAVEIIHPFEV